MNWSETPWRPWTSYQIHEIAGCACAENAGNVFPATDFKGNRWLAIPTCITARASRTCRDACQDRYPTLAGKTFRHSRRMCNPHFYVSGKRPMWRQYNACSCFLGCTLLLSESISKSDSQIAKFMGPTWGPPGTCRPQMGPMLAPWTLLSGL